MIQILRNDYETPFVEPTRYIKHDIDFDEMVEYDGINEDDKDF